MRKIPVGILGATGMVGQRFVSLLENHPWFDVVILAASPRSAGKSYEEAVNDRWRLDRPMPEYAKKLRVYAVAGDLSHIAKQVRLVFSALDMEKDAIKALEIAYASAGVAVVSNNSAHRWTTDIPMIMPEVNPEHTDLIHIQRKRRGWDKGLLVVKPNCSLQSYVPVIHALSSFIPLAIEVTTLQAISGAGKTFAVWPEMLDNCIPFIGGEEEKTEKEPLKILGTVKNGSVKLAKKPTISATCIRVAVADGHMASVAVKFVKKPTLRQIISAISDYKNPIENLGLPTAPHPFIQYFAEDNRPQTRMDRDLGNGMTISCGRFREDQLFDWKFVSLSHNTIRGAAGGALLTAELLRAKELI
ncbi:MAG: aspartate-semialdehyde dehydrogenase [Candidatus Levybacteria bacterium]|nr:aspartate-semialdehyde dehydrogenase [Candidatus Levybacteria bacterium]